MVRRPRILAAAILLASLPVLAGCIGIGGGGSGSGANGSPTASEFPPPSTDQTTGEPCPDGIPEAIEDATPQVLVVEDVDPTTFSGPAGYEGILEGLPLSCVARLTGPVDYAYFYGEDDTLVAELVKRIEAVGFTPLGGNTSAGGYWIDENGMVITLVYSPDGADTAVPGSDADDPPLVGAGTNQPFVAISFF